MSKLDLYNKQIWKQYSNSSSKPLPKMTVKKGTSNCLEGFLCTLEAGNFHVFAKGPLGRCYAQNQLALSFQSGYTQDYLGEKTPYFPLRALYLECEKKCNIPDTCMEYAMPNFLSLSQEKTPLNDLFCQKILNLGFNACAFSISKQSETSLLKQDHMDAFIQTMQEYGLGIIFEVHHRDSFKDPNFLQDITQLKKVFPKDSFLIWEGKYLQEKQSDQETDYDLVKKEISLLEKALEEHFKLIYLLPATDQVSISKQCYFIDNLCNFIQSKNLIAFSPLYKKADGQTRQESPLWEALCCSRQVPEKKCLPLLNVGSIKFGKGLWPDFRYDILNDIFTKMQNPVFYGALCMSTSIPKESSFSYCNLWTAGQKLWYPKKSATLFSKIWLLIYYPEIPWEDFQWIAHYGQQIRHQMQTLQDPPELLKDKQILTSLALSLSNNCDMLKATLRRYVNSSSKGTQSLLLAAYPYFLRDSKKILFQTLKDVGISLPGLLDGEDMQLSFFTKMEQAKDFQVFKGSDIELLEDIDPKHLDGTMQSIYKSCFFELT